MMNGIFKNPEIRSIVLKLLILQFLFMALILALISYEYITIYRIVGHKNIALVGKILSSHPELEDEIISIVTKKATYEEVEKGQAILDKYGYSQDISLLAQPDIKICT